MPQATASMSSTPDSPLLVKLLSADAQLPSRQSVSAAGYDIFSAESLEIPARSQRVVRTDIALAIAPGLYGRVAPRSGLAAKHAIDVGAGVLDSDYRGPVGIVLFNHGANPFAVNKGDRIAQLILERIATPSVVQVNELDDTGRGSGGFGSTGTK